MMTAADIYKENFDNLWAERQTFQTQWQEVVDLVRPNAKYFMRDGYQGDRRTLRIYDATAVLACGELAGGLQSYLVNPSERWFNYVVKDPKGTSSDTLMQDDDVLLWLEIVSDIIYTYYSFPRTAFNPTINELFGDLAAFGTSGMYQDWDYDTEQLRFRTIPLADMFIDENGHGMVDTIYRCVFYTYRRAKQVFGEDLPAKLIKDGEKEGMDGRKKYKFLHVVEPNESYDRRQLMTQPTGKGKVSNMPYKSVWVWLEGGDQVTPSGSPCIIGDREKGFRTNPYVTPRWQKVPNEVYGRSPAIDLLPTIKMLNASSRVLIGASEKVIDPPILVPDDNFLGPIRTLPGALIKYDSTTPNIRDRVVPLETKANIPVGREFIKDLQDVIDRGFHLDYLRAERKKERQSVQEIHDDRDEMLRLLAPILGRQEAELLGQTLSRTYNILNMEGKIPPCPHKIRHMRVFPEYVSPAARAQSGSRALEIGQFMQDILPYTQLDPNIADIVDTDEAARQIAIARDITRRVIRNKRDIDKIRKQRQAQQQMQQMAQVGEQASSAIKNLGQGQQAFAAAQGTGPQFQGRSTQ